MKKKHLLIQKNKLITGQIDRRSFVMSALATGLALPTALSMAGSAMAQMPKRGGKFILGSAHGSTTDSMDPGTYENGFSTSLGYMMGNGLTEVSNTGELIGDLAESWEASTDAKTWRFTLRSGVEFHNAKTMTADDVIATMNYHRGEDSKSAAKGLLESVVDLGKDGDNVVVFTLAEGNADFPYIMSDYHLSIRIGTEGVIDPLTMIGTGAYVLNAYDPGVRAAGTRNPNYYKEGAANFDEVEMLSLLDVTARQNAIMSGEVHAVDRVDPKTVALMQRVPTLDILEITGTLHYTMPMRVDAAPFDNADLRMALKLSVKRQEMVDKILLGHGVVGNDHPISTANRYHASDLAQREFDPDMARHYYEKSGHSGTIQLSSSDAAFAGAVDAAQLVAASAAEVGIDIEVVREPSDGYWSNVWNKKPWSVSYWGGRPTEDWMFSAAYVDTTEWNETNWKTTDDAVAFNALVIEARAELDDTKRRALYVEAQTLIHNDGGALVPMFANYIMGIDKSVAHDENVAANWELDGAKWSERWWFA